MASEFACCIYQVLCFFKWPGFYEKLKYRFSRNCDSNNLYDIYDGDIYEKHFDSGAQLADLNKISFVSNSDRPRSPRIRQYCQYFW